MNKAHMYEMVLNGWSEEEIKDALSAILKSAIQEAHTNYAKGLDDLAELMHGGLND